MKKFYKLCFVLLIMLSVCGVVACGDPYEKISLESSTKNIEIEVDESTSFSVSIKNYFNDMSGSISVNPDNEVVEITDIDYQKDGVAVVSLKGLKVGKGNLIISTFEGSKSCLVAVNVSLPVSSFALKTNPFIVKEAGKTYNLNEVDWFSFSPPNASTTNVSFYYNNEGVAEKIVSVKTIQEDLINDSLLTLLVTDTNKEISVLSDTFSLTAKLDNYPEINPVIFDVDIVESIQTTGISIIKTGLYSNSYIPENQREVLNENSVVTLVSNDFNSSYYEFEIGIKTSNVSVEIDSVKTEYSRVIPSLEDFTPTSSNSYIFGLQAKELGEDVVIVKLFYEDYSGYEIVKSFKVNVLNAPTSIYVNDKTSSESLKSNVILYDENYGESAIKNLNLAVYSTDSKFESVDVEILQSVSNIDNAIPFENWSDYITLVYKNQTQISNFSIPYSDFEYNYLISSLLLEGKQIYDGNIYIKFTLNSSLIEENSIVHYVPIVIKEGATSFSVSENYQNGLSVDLNDGEKLFSGLIIKSDDAYIGLYSFEYLDNSNFIFEVKQVLEGDKNIFIKPLAVGDGRVKITLPNGLSCTLSIKIEVGLNDVNLSVQNSEFISQVEFDDNENVSGLAVNFTLNQNQDVKIIDLNLRLLTNPTTATLYNIESEIVNGNNIISFNENTFILSILGVGEADLKITIYRQKVENFNVVGIVGQEEGIVFNVHITSFSPITSLYYQQKNQTNNSTTIVTSVDVYKATDVGYYYQQRGFSTFELDLVATLYDGSKPEDLFNYYAGKISWATQLGEPIVSSSSSVGTFQESGTITNFGQYEISGNHLKFICDDTYAQANTSFWIAFTITEYDFSFTAVLNINIRPYVPLESVGFYNWQDEVYLSDENKTFTFDTFLNPEADCQEFDVEFVPLDNTASSLISATVNASFSQITIQYNGTGTGKGYVVIIPRTSYINETEYTQSQIVSVFVSDGSDKSNPLPISSAQGFISVMSDPGSLNKHYKITTTLDFDGLEIPCFNQFYGSIVGENGVAKLINLNITQTRIEGSNTYLGLFSKISSTAEIKNIEFEGSLNLTQQTSNNIYAGLIAGENLGYLENVSVVIKNSNIQIENLSESYSGAEIAIGGVVGVNRGAILTFVDKNLNTTNHTLLNSISQSSSQNPIFSVKYMGHSQNTSVGGVVGINLGVIDRIVNEETNLYNTSNYSARINLYSVGFCSTGAIAGKNQKQTLNLDFVPVYKNSIISNMIIEGNIVAERYEINVDKSVGGVNVGGVVGTNNSYIQKNVTRTFVAGYDYVGGIAGKDDSIAGYTDNPTQYDYVTQNTVQAIYQTNFKYMLTALSNSGNIGAISGNENSTINQKLYSSTNQAFYYYESNISGKIFPVAYSKIGNDFEFIKYNKDIPYYSLFAYQDIVVEVDRIESDYDLGAGKLETENVLYDNFVAYMFYYQAEQSTQQKYIDYLNLSRNIPFVFSYPDSVNITSLNREILNIDSNGKINIYGTGLAILQVSSILNNTKGSIYLYILVTNAFNQYTINASNNSVITNGSTIVVYQNSPIELKYFFNHSGIEVKDDYNQSLLVELVNNNDASLTYHINEEKQYIKITDVGNSLIFNIGGEIIANASNTITFVPVFKTNIANVGAVNMFYGDKENNIDSEMDNLITETTSETSIIALAQKGTERFEVNFSSTTVEPLDVFTVNINQVTDYDNDSLHITFAKVGETFEVDDYFIIESFKGYDATEITNLYNYTGQNGTFKFVFNYQKYALNNEDYDGIYYINFIADNGVVETITVNLIKQQVSNITLKNYYNVVGSVDKTKAEENFVAPGANSVLQIDVYPYFADFDYISVNNASTNFTNNTPLVLEVVYETDQGNLETLYGVEYTTDGVNIPIRVIKQHLTSLTSAQILVRYTTTSSAVENSKATLVVSAVKLQNGSDIVTQSPIIQFQQEKTVNVIIKDTVEFKIRGKEAIDGKYYVAKGLSYDLDVIVHGFSTDEIVTQSTSNYAEIRLQNDGSYKLNIASNINYISGQEGYNVTITTYGQTVVDGLYYTSDKIEINLVIVDFVVLLENLVPLNLNEQSIDDYSGSTVIQNAENGLMRVAIGNTTPLAVKLINGVSVEYDTNSAIVSKAVQNFEDSLTRNATWGISAKQIGIAGPYITKTEFTGNTYINNEYLRITSNIVNGDYTYSYAPLKLTSAQNALYNLTFNSYFKYLNGIPTLALENEQNVFSLATDIAVEVYATGLENNAIPIYTYDDFINMQEGMWYMQLDDIVLPTDFSPINVAIAGFNGNGFSFSFNSNWRVQNLSAVGLFGTLPEKTVVKNVKIDIKQSLNVEITNANAVNFGFIAGVNNGAITNCSVVSDEYATANIVILGQQETITNNYVAGITGYNNGFITNSQVKMNLVAGANLAGLVGVNANIIASSYVSESKLINKSGDVLNHTAGFVVRNGITTSSTEPAIIQTSYVSGEFSAINVYSSGVNKIINSQTQVAGFVFDNYGNIENSYSNIPIHSSSTRAGFVFRNGGNINNTYSTSTFGESGQTAYGYIVFNKIDDVVGTVTNSFYLLGTVNSTVNKTTISGVTALSEIEFSIENYFENFILSSSTNKRGGIWFYPSRSVELEFAIDGQQQQFIYGKPELVAPNLIAVSQKSLDSENITVDPVTGQTTYVYIENKNAEGSVYNPHTISSANELETLITQNSNRNINNSYYRIVANIDYTEENINNSMLYKIIFKGDIEGNGMTIKGYVIDTKENLTNGGLFAKIGNGNTGEGAVRNLNIAPKYINMPNTDFVGSLAGSLESGSLYNVNALGFEYEQTGLVIIGHYAVGGVVGVAINNFKINNISSSISARASYDSSQEGEKVGIFTNTKTTKISYAGAIIGVANNSGEIINSTVSREIASMAEIAGLMFGKIGNNVIAENINIEIISGQFVRASAYGGIIAGELCGDMKNVTVRGNADSNFFKINPIVPKVIGGMVGFMQSGSIENATSYINLVWNVSSPSLIGGVVGEMLGGQLNNVNFVGSINIIGNTQNSAGTNVTVGGIVGRTNYQPTVNVSSQLRADDVSIINCSTGLTNNVNNPDSKITVKTDSLYRVTVGGLVGESILTYETFSFNNKSHCRVGNVLTFNGCENHLDISINSVIFEGTYYGTLGGIVGGVYADASKTYAGEAIIFDELTMQELYDLYSSCSHSKLSINVTNMKNQATAILKYGGIFGFGVPVAETTSVEGVPTQKIPFGDLLENAIKLQTAPEYDGQYEIDENQIKTPILRMQDSQYLVLPSENSNLNLVLEQNNYWNYL